MVERDSFDKALSERGLPTARPTIVQRYSTNVTFTVAQTNVRGTAVPGHVSPSASCCAAVASSRGAVNRGE